MSQTLITGKARVRTDTTTKLNYLRYAIALQYALQLHIYATGGHTFHSVTHTLHLKQE
jgi:hypothetical protein